MKIALAVAALAMSIGVPAVAQGEGAQSEANVDEVPSRVEYIRCFLRYRGHYIVAKPFKVDLEEEGISRKMSDAWSSYLAERTGISYDEITGWGPDKFCYNYATLEHLEFSAHNYEGPEWEVVEFPFDRMGLAVPERQQPLPARFTGGIVIEDRRPDTSAAELAAARREGQRRTAEAIAKAAAQSAVSEAQQQAQVRQLLEDMRRRCGGASTDVRPGACAQ